MANQEVPLVTLIGALCIILLALIMIPRPALSPVAPSPGCQLLLFNGFSEPILVKHSSLPEGDMGLEPDESVVLFGVNEEDVYEVQVNGKMRKYKVCDYGAPPESR